MSIILLREKDSHGLPTYSMRKTYGKWHSLLWQPIDYHDDAAYKELKTCPKFFHSPDSSSSVKSYLESIYQNIYLIECFESIILIDNLPTHYRVGKIMPGDLAKYDEWLVDYHGVSQKELEDLSKKRELYESKVFLEYSNRMIRHDLHSGINTYIPRGLAMLKRKLTEKVIKDLGLSSALTLLEKGVAHAQMVYKSIHSFTGLVKQDAQIEMEEFDLTESLKKYIEFTAYSGSVEIKKLPVVYGNEALICSAVLQLIQNGIKYNSSDIKSSVVYSDDEGSIFVEDNGVGMSQEEFNSFIFPDESQTITCMGLNIAIVIFEEHGYSIEVFSSDRKGTIMKVKKKNLQKY